MQHLSNSLPDQFSLCQGTRVTQEDMQRFMTQHRPQTMPHPFRRRGHRTNAIAQSAPTTTLLKCFHLERRASQFRFLPRSQHVSQRCTKPKPMVDFAQNQPRGGAPNAESQPTSEITPPNTVPSTSALAPAPPAHLPGASRAHPCPSPTPLLWLAFNANALNSDGCICLCAIWVCIGVPQRHRI